jgi:hypothetical protein
LSREVYSPSAQQPANKRRAYTVTSNENFGNFLGHSTQSVRYVAQKLKPAFPIVPKGEPVSEIDLASIEPAENKLHQEIFRSHKREFRRECEHDCLIDSHPLHAFHLLVEGLKKRRRSLRVQNGARMRIECNDSRWKNQLPRTFDNSSHYQLMSEVKAVKHAES